ncbi:hypothetical protein [Actinomarinicola tropica]|uniref:Lipid droplet-associated protein n=1 Tax=Actinomarinicola tropica TaxID=2789776 RepID=A0A5Q2REP3_9ACTN|nr:hypothetical protein [Actinomarinicola tropica]QGG95279.1 hypothetical protein GH723_09330 [Actinomarinicola tropica]
MSEERDPLAVLLDTVVYAPIGAALHGPEAVEELAAKGRQDVANARVIGKLALARGRTEAVRLAGEVQDVVGDLLVAAARAAGAPMAGPTTPPPTTDAPADGPPTTAPSEPEEATHLTVVPDAAPDAEELAIPDYDNLSASQVVPRLDDLAEDELAAVQAYERAHRGRMTILSRIAQLQAS